MSYAIMFKGELDAVDPRLFYLLITSFAFGAVYLWRRVSMATFNELPKGAQALPATFLTILFSTAANATSLKEAFIGALAGAVSGLGAIGFHHVLKAAPGPYGDKKE